MKEKNTNLVTIPKCSRALGLSPNHLRRQIRIGKWPSYEFGVTGRCVRVDIGEIKSLAKVDKTKNG